MWVKLSIGTAVLVVSVAGGLARVSTAAAASTPTPAIVAIAATPSVLAATGGTVKVSVHVLNAATCAFRGQVEASASLGPPRAVSCASGRAGVSFRIAANQRAAAATLHFSVTATARSGRSVQKTVTVRQAAAQGDGNTPSPPAAPLQITTTALDNGRVGVTYDGSIAATGGTRPYTWTVDSGSLPPGLTLGSSDGVFVGAPTGAGQSLFVVRVTDAKGRTATASLSITVVTAKAGLAPSRETANWSGYTLDAGPFARVTGTFNVPLLTNATGPVYASEWVGVDGDSPGNTSLIQAGVTESVSASGGTETYAWWEILPAHLTRITTVDVHSRDSVTVTITQAGTGLWTITLLDNTNGQSFSTTQTYTGLYASVEWIVEAPGIPTTTLGAYTPNVTFTNMSWSGSGTTPVFPQGLTFYPISMSQHGTTVSVPSALSSDQTSFAVAFGSTPPPAPG